jgi:hypothetical protein
MNKTAFLFWVRSVFRRWCVDDITIRKCECQIMLPLNHALKIIMSHTSFHSSTSPGRQENVVVSGLESLIDNIACYWYCCCCCSTHSKVSSVLNGRIYIYTTCSTTVLVDNTNASNSKQADRIRMLPIFYRLASSGRNRHSLTDRNRHSLTDLLLGTTGPQHFRLVQITFHLFQFFVHL